MARILTGIQSSGRQHLGNVLGAIKPAIALANKPENESFLFIADLHSLTSIKNGEERKANVLATAAAWLACGLDTDKSVFYLQSNVPQCTELTWYLNCFTPYPMLANAHSFKDKSENLADVNAGLFDYPVLMASDILLYNANIVPVGKDQKQHVEITRDIARAFNHSVKEEIFVIPESAISSEVMVIPGTDGRKMSKSYGNVIDIFLPEKKLKKQIMGIVTDSLGIDDAKDPDGCNVYALYKLLATPEQDATIRKKYTIAGGGFGYGHAKLALLELVLDNFGKERAAFDKLIANPKEIQNELYKGARKAEVVANETLNKVRKSLGF